MKPLTHTPGYGIRKPDLGMIEPNMGTSRAITNQTRPSRLRPAAAVPRIGLADALFSGTQQRVLALLFGQPDRSFYGSELIQLCQAGSGAVQRELARLVQSELVTLRQIGSQKHYQANPASPIHAELCGIAQKTVGLAEPLRVALGPVAHLIDAAFVYGSVAKRRDTASSDIDLMLIGELSYADLFMSLDELSDRLGRTINPTIYSPRELAQRVASGEAFVNRVLEQPKIWLFGGEHELGLRPAVRPGAAAAGGAA